MSTSDKLHVEFQDLELQLRKRLAELESRVEDTVRFFLSTCCVQAVSGGLFQDHLVFV